MYWRTDSNCNYGSIGKRKRKKEKKRKEKKRKEKEKHVLKSINAKREITKGAFYRRIQKRICDLRSYGFFTTKNLTAKTRRKSNISYL